MQIDYIQILVFISIAFLCSFYRFIAKREKSRLLKIPLGLIILYAILKALIPVFSFANLPNVASMLSVAAILVIWMAVIRTIIFFIVDYFIRQKRGVAFPTITRDFALGILYIVAAMIVVKQQTNVNLGSLLTTSAILSVVVGFALQDTLGNLFSGLALQMEHPYQIGDWIGFEGLEGKVEGITWKSTKILTRSEEMIFVPNNTIAKSTLINYSQPTNKHVTFVEIGASYDDPPHKVKKAVIDVIKNNPKALANHPPLVVVTKYDNFSINYKAFFATEDFASEGRTKAEILNDIWYKFRREGIKIPYPMQEQMDILPAELRAAAKQKRAQEESEIGEAFGKIDLFGALPADVLKDLTSRIAVLEFSSGEAIVRQGDEPGPMYVIKDGECSVQVSHDGAEPIELAKLGPRQFFGEMSVLTGAPRTATVKALTNAICYEIEKEDLKAIFSNSPLILSKISEILVSRQAALSKHKAKMEDEATLRAKQQGELMSKIKAFFGI
ncbi:MAG: mechanosensitive ion channel [Deltaproteobacteria bacterium]|nr:mechanosensitive ion channel [Deltaproteobacteria bacterium]